MTARSGAAPSARRAPPRSCRRLRTVRNARSCSARCAAPSATDKVLGLMRYTKIALLVFDLWLIVGFALIVAEVPSFGLIGSAIMALGLVGLPVALVADGRIAFVQRILARFSRPKRPQPHGRSRAVTSRAVGRPSRRRPPARVARRRRR